MTSRFAVILVLLLLSALAGADSSIRVYPLHLQDNYRQDYTWKTLRDRAGYLWLATSNGLQRYDGYGLKTFINKKDNPRSLASDTVRALHLHSDGTLWVAGNVLHRYHPETEDFTRYPVSDYQSIYAIHEDNDGALWLGGDGFGLRRFDPDTGNVSHTFLENTASPASVFLIKPHSDTRHLWLASNRGLLSFNLTTHSSETYFAFSKKNASNLIFGMEEDSEGKIWLATANGLFIVDPATRSAQRVQADYNDPAFSANNFSALHKDNYGRLWIGTDKHGVYRYSPKADKFQHYPASANDPYRFPLARINDIHEDAEGTLWFATPFHGTYRISEHLQKFKSFQHSFDTDNSLIFNNVLAMHEDAGGFIWIATDGGGLDRFDPNTYRFTHFRHDPGNSNSLSSDSILDIAEDSQGFLWLGTWAGGLNRLDPKTGEVTRILPDPEVKDGQTLAGNHVVRLVIDEQDRLVMGIAGTGLQIYDTRTKTFETFAANSETGLRNHYITDILPTPDGNYWVGGYLGIELFSPDTGIAKGPTLEPDDGVIDIHMSREGLLWLATTRGLLRLNPKTSDVSRFTANDGLPDNHVVGIEQDREGYLWLATRNGLARFDPIDKEVEVFRESDGLAGAQFNRLSHLQTRDGTIYVGSINGFSSFNPLAIPRNEYAPQIHFTSLTINNKPYTDTSKVPPNIRFLERLTLPSRTKHIHIGFTATNLVSPSQNQYRYRLKGLNEDWFSVGSDVRSVQYNNLPAGDYLLQVVASNNDGVWTGGARELPVTILPAWWQTWWAYAVYCALLGAIIYGFSVWRLYLNDKQRRQLKVLVNEQTEKLVAANRAIQQFNAELEQRVAQRTHDLSVEIEERKESEAKVTYIAYHDALTGLYNRAWLLQTLKKLLYRSATTDEPFAVLFIGGDRFRKINDTYGHQTGDKLLIATAQKLQELCTGVAEVTRIGSDEFVVIVEHLSSREQVIELADNIVAGFNEPRVIDQMLLAFSVSVGFLIADKRYDDPAQVLRDTNIAMQRAKDRGRGLYQEFDEEILQQTLDLSALESDLRLALSRQQFSVVYQPIILLKSNRIVRFETLLRWQHPERGWVPPDNFIPLAEASGSIFDIGLWVLEQACLQLRQWRESVGSANLPTIAVNLSPVQLERIDFLDRVDDIFRATGVEPGLIEFEITETALMGHTDTTENVLEGLRERGIKLAIDDFGTGYSSLSYLDKLPVQVLKIDRSFVNALTETNGRNSTSEIIRSTITLAHNLGMSVVAEGIETQQQLQTLQSYGCDCGQGYFIARPMPPTDATTLFTIGLADWLAQTRQV